MKAIQRTPTRALSGGAGDDSSKRKDEWERRFRDELQAVALALHRQSSGADLRHQEGLLSCLHVSSLLALCFFARRCITFSLCVYVYVRVFTASVFRLTVALPFLQVRAAAPARTHLRVSPSLYFSFGRFFFPCFTKKKRRKNKTQNTTQGRA